MSDTPNESPLIQESTLIDKDAEIRAQLLADGVPESDITPELISERLEIDGKLDDTAMISGETLAAYRRRLLSAAEEAANITPEGIAKNVTAAAKDVTAEAVDGINDKLINYTAETVGGVFQNVPGAAMFQDIIKNVVASLFGGLGIGAFIKGFFNKIMGKEEEEPVVKEPVVKEPVVKEPVVKEPVVKEPVVKEPVVSTGVEQKNESFGEGRFRIGSRLILELNGTTQEFAAVDHIKTSHGLQNMSYAEILTLGSKTIPEGFYNTEEIEGNRNFYSHSITALQSETTKSLLRIGFKQESLLRIIFPYGEINENLAIQFGETPEQGKIRLQNILEKINNGTFNWQNDLSYKEVSILYLASIPALRIPAIEGMKSIGTELNTLFFGEDGAIENYGNSPFSKEFLEAFAKLNSYVLSNDSTNEDTIVKERFLAGVPEENKERLIIELDRLIKFKNYIIADDFYANPKLGLNPKEQETFKANISLAHIVVLEGIMGSESNLENISPLAIPPLIYIVGKILGRGGANNTLESSMYMGRYIKDALLNSESVFNEDESTVLKIYGQKILDIILLSHVNSMVSLLGGAQGATNMDLNTLTIGTLLGATAVRFTGVRMIRSALQNSDVSLGGVWLKRAGNIGILAGIALGGTNWYINQGETNLARDIDAAGKNDDILKIIEALQKQQDAIETIELSDGTEVKVFAYPGDTPIYVINGKVFELKTGGLNIIEQWEQSEPGLESVISIGKETILNLFSSRTGTVDNTDYKQQRYENGDIIFGIGEDEIRLSASEIITESALSIPETLGEDFMRQVTQGERGLEVFGFDIGSEGETGYFLGKLDDNTVMFLSEVGPVEELFSTIK